MVDFQLKKKRYTGNKGLEYSTGNYSQYLAIMENNLKYMCICITESPCYAPKTFCQLYFNKIYILRAHTHTHTHIEQLGTRPWWRRAQKTGQSTLLVHRARRPASGAWRRLFLLPGSSSRHLCSSPATSAQGLAGLSPSGCKLLLRCGGTSTHTPTPALPTPPPHLSLSPQHTDLCGIRLLVGFYYLLSQLDVLRSMRTLMSQLIRQDPDAGEDRGLEEKGATEDEMARRHHRLHGHEFEWTLEDDEGQGSLVCYSPWGCKESDPPEQLKNY